MLAPQLRGAFAAMAIGALSFLSACKSDVAAPKPSSAAKLAVLSGDGQSGLVGTTLQTPLEVQVTSKDGSPLANVLVTFAVTLGEGTLSPTSARTDATGKAHTVLTLKANVGRVEVTATVSGTTIVQVLVATAVPPDVPCTASNAVSMSVGQVLAALPAQSVCLSGGGGGSEFAVIPFNGSPVFTANKSLNFTSTGASAVTTPALSAKASVAGSVVQTAPALPARDFRFEGRLRESETRELTPLVASARAWRRARLASAAETRGALKVSIPSLTVGQTVSLNANADDPCTNASMRTGRVVAISNNSVVIADVNNPTGGYTDAEYQSIAVTFDTLVLALDQAAFGNATDIDQNGHIVLFFTRAVNELTEAGNSSSIVGGFFYARDLFPKTATADFQACAGSNVGEMFYLMVPDPNGVVNGNVRSKAAVSRLTISTTAHELQHLINAARRLYVNDVGGEDWEEELWLNEGLSHVAEELLFYRESGLAPRQNVDLPTLRTSQRILDAFNNDQIQNTSRYGSYLRQPSISSPYAPNDSLHTRGATWSLLRYLADHRGTTDGDVWSRLANSTTRGMSNLQQVYGSELPNLVRDWATSVLTDDIAGVDARYQQPSWNFRSIFTAMSSFNNTFPLQTLTVADGSPRSVTLRGGGTAFVRFGVAGGGIGSVFWGIPPDYTSVSIVRTR